MFVQVIQGRVSDAAGLKRQFDRWQEELAPSAEGWLGITGGITEDGRFVALARFTDEDAARKNSDRREQGDWWAETEKCLADVMFHDCTLVDTTLGGGSDDAGFVQVMQGKVTDVEKARALNAEGDKMLPNERPDVIGGITAWHPQNGRFTAAYYFTSEAEARKGEAAMADSESFGDYAKQMGEIADGEPEYMDLKEPWLSSK